MDYKGFISYSHSTDQRLAPAIQRGLSTFARPWHRLRTMRIFRDQTNLAVSAGLWSSIEIALRKSEYFLLLASPAAAASPWVGKEIDWWLENRSSKTLLIVLTEGTMRWNEASGDFDWQHTSAVSKRLANVFAEEPLYIDLSWAKSLDELSTRHTRFRAAIIDIAATLLGRPRDELDGADVREHRRNKRIAWTAVAGLLVLLTASLVASYIAVEQQKIATNRLAGLCKSLDEAQVLADSNNHGSVYYFQSEFHAISEQCKNVDYTTWGN
jgi:hypothetical protein